MNNLDNENLTIDTLTEFAKPYRDKVLIKNQKIAQKNKIKAEKLNKRIQKKTEKLIKKITSKIVRRAKKGLDEYSYSLPYKYVKGIDYNRECLKRIKTYYTDKGFSVIIGKDVTYYVDIHGHVRSPIYYHCITISWKKYINNGGI